MAKSSGTTKGGTKSNPKGLNISSGYNVSAEEAKKIQADFNANRPRLGTSQGTYYTPYWSVSVNNNGYRVSIADRGIALERKVKAIAEKYNFDYSYNNKESDSFSSVYDLKKKK